MSASQLLLRLQNENFPQGGWFFSNFLHCSFEASCSQIPLKTRYRQFQWVSYSLPQATEKTADNLSENPSHIHYERLKTLKQPNSRIAYQHSIKASKTEVPQIFQHSLVVQRLQLHQSSNCCRTNRSRERHQRIINLKEMGGKCVKHAQSLNWVLQKIIAK